MRIVEQYFLCAENTGSFKRLVIYERIAAEGMLWSVDRTFAGYDEFCAFHLRQQNTHITSLKPPFINIPHFCVESFLAEQL